MSVVPEKEALWDEEVRPYVRPTMDEVRAIPWNGLRAVSTFSGCGGSSLGLRMAGFRVPYAVEFVPAAADTYEANSDAYVDRRDVREIRGIEVRARLGLGPGELDVFEGSPPCSFASMAGIRERGWNHEKKYSETRQRTDDLFDEYVRLVRVLRPRAFVAENVPGMIQGATVEAYTHNVTMQLTALGYRVWVKVLNSANYGVPQDRRRLIFVGLREDQEREWEWPPVESYRFSLRAALASVDAEDPDHAPFLAESSMERFAVGRAWEIAKGLRREGSCLACGNLLRPRLSGQGRCECEDPTEAKDYFMLTVPSLDAPCPTLTATAAQVGAASVAHPTECRKFSPSECKAIMGFPSDFVLTGTREQRCERMGRAVSPPLYRAVGRQLVQILR